MFLCTMHLHIVLCLTFTKIFILDRRKIIPSKFKLLAQNYTIRNKA